MGRAVIEVDRWMDGRMDGCKNRVTKGKVEHWTTPSCS